MRLASIRVRILLSFYVFPVLKWPKVLFILFPSLKCLEADGSGADEFFTGFERLSRLEEGRQRLAPKL